MAVNWTTLAKDYNVFEGSITKRLDATEQRSIKKIQVMISLKSAIKSHDMDATLRKAKSTFHSQSKEKMTHLAQMVAFILRKCQEIASSTSIISLQNCLESIMPKSEQLASVDATILAPEDKIEVGKVLQARQQEVLDCLDIQVKHLMRRDREVTSASKWTDFLSQDDKLSMLKLLSLFSISQTLQRLSVLINETEIASSSRLLSQFCELASKATFARMLMSSAEYYILKDQEFSGQDHLDFAFQYLNGQHQKLGMFLDADEHAPTDNILKVWLYFMFVGLLQNKLKSIMELQISSLKVRGNLLFIFCRELKNLTDSLYSTKAEVDWATGFVLNSKGKEMLIDFSKVVFLDMDSNNVG